MTEVSAGTLTDFLLARFDEDEADIDARNMTCGCAVEGFPMLHGVTCPAKLRADYEAKRRIVTECDHVRKKREGTHAAELAQWTLETLTIPYADHEHFREEWRL